MDGRLKQSASAQQQQPPQPRHTPLSQEQIRAQTRFLRVDAKFLAEESGLWWWIRRPQVTMYLRGAPARKKLAPSEVTFPPIAEAAAAWLEAQQTAVRDYPQQRQI